MSNYASLERYIPLVEFMGKICGKNYEIILHDVSTPERSVIAACNEHLSGRRVGDPMTELAKELLRTGVYQEHDYVANYEVPMLLPLLTYASALHKMLRSVPARRPDHAPLPRR